MKVFVFKSTNEKIGRFNIDTFDDLPSAFRIFAETRDVAPSDYLECSGHSWTVVKGADGLELAEGRHRPKKQRKLPESSESVAPSRPVSASRYPALQILSVIYRIFACVTGIAAMIIIVVGIATIKRGSAAFIIWGIVGGIVGVVTNLAIAEGIKVFIDIEENTRSTFLHISRQKDVDTP